MDLGITNILRRTLSSSIQTENSPENLSFPRKKIKNKQYKRRRKRREAIDIFLAFFFKKKSRQKAREIK